MYRGKIKEIFKLCRLPSSIGASITPAIGALSVKGYLLNISHFFPLLLLGVFFNILGVVLNDFIDIHFDEFSKEFKDRPLVKKTVSRKAVFLIIIIGLVIIFSISIFFFWNLLAILILIISLDLGVLYNIFSKKLIGSDIFLASSMAFFCLFGALAVSDNIHSLNEINHLTWIVVVIIFIYVFIMNILEGNLKDVNFDRKAGALTIPVFLGVKTGKIMHVTISFKTMIVGLKILLVFFIFSTFIFFNLIFWFWQIIILILFAFVMLWATFKILYMSSFNILTFAFYGRIHGVFSYLVIPIMLMRFIGINWTLFLILFTASCPLIFNYLLYGKSLTPVVFIK